MDQITLETERLIMRPFRLEDAEGVLEFSSNPEVQKYTGDVMRTSLEEVKPLITDVWFSDYEKYGYGRFAVIHKADNKIIGFSGIKYLQELDQTDLGYRFLPQYWGMGIATESSVAMLKYAFQQQNLDEIIAFVEPENPASAAVLKKLGFQFNKFAPFPGENKNIAWFTLTKEDYERQ